MARERADLPTRWPARSRRRHVEVALGVLWLLDGVLQFQPYMFTRAFMDGILGMANMGLPGPLARADFDTAQAADRRPCACGTRPSRRCRSLSASG